MSYLKIIFFLTILFTHANAVETISDKTKNMKKSAGFINYFWDEQSGNLYLEIKEFEKEVLFLTSVSQGLGSNDIGIDRGKLDRERIVYFKKVGNKVLLIQPNYDYRAITDNQSEIKTVQESFASSVLWGFEVEAASSARALINLTPFLFSDIQNIGQHIEELDQGTYKIDVTRSAINMQRSKNFPLNTEMDAILTFTGNDPGNFIYSVTPTAEAITIHQHFSFIQLPDNHYKKREFDPRAGFYGISYQDYATPISQPLTKRFITRHRLEKKFPDKEKSPVLKPIIYYVDNGAPEPIRSTLIEGASWWAEAFEEAGFENAFQVKVLPDDADPMDVRYNVIQWVHRSTRGWSYGNSVVDPRTGEIIKGHVSLGSLRVRQDFLIASGLLAPFKDGSVPNEMQNMALARLRQLSAHEVGHTIGLMHNFAASVKNRASVMDYPHPLIKINEDNTLDLSRAYDNKIGGWDKIAIKYGYTQYNSSEEEKVELQKIINEYIANGFKYITDADARPSGGAHPYAHLWDNGNNAADDLDHILKVRQIALAHFSENIINNDVPYSQIEQVLVPIYLMHRYAVEAASKLVGGLDYSYAVKNDGQKITGFIDPQLQIKAFDALLKAISSEQLILDEKLLQILPPHPPGYARNTESFESRTGVTFDPLSAAESAVNITLMQIFNGQRIARLMQYNHRQTDNPQWDDLYKRYFEKIFESAFKKGLQGDIQRLVQVITVDQLIRLYQDKNSASYVQTWVYTNLKSLEEWTTDRSDIDHFSFINHKIQQFFKDPDKVEIHTPVDIPPGSPIGTLNCGL